MKKKHDIKKKQENSADDLIAYISNEFCKFLFDGEENNKIEKIGPFLDTYETTIKECNQYNSHHHLCIIRNVVQSYIQDFLESQKPISSLMSIDQCEIFILSKWNNIPNILRIVIDEIKKLTDSYFYFERFYHNRSQETINNIEQLVEEKEKNITQVVKDIPTEAANKAAEKAADRIYKTVDRVVNKEVNKSVVSVLAIFASVIIAIVGAFIYTSSILNNILYVDLYKLIFVCLTIGFVFVNIMFTMFYYVDRIKKGREEKQIEDKHGIKNIGKAITYNFELFVKQHTFIVAINIVFLLLFICFSIFYNPVDLRIPDEQKKDNDCCVCIALKENINNESIRIECNCFCHCEEDKCSKEDSCIGTKENCTEEKAETIETESILIPES